MNKKKQLNWGILGTGFIAHYMAQAISESKKNTLLAVASRDIAKATAFAQLHAVKNIYSDYQHLLEDKNIDVVYIALPNNLHAEWIIKAALANKHILCEKPFAVNFHQTQQALSAVEKAGVFCMEAFMYRCHPQTQRLIELLQQDSIGKIRLIEAAYTFPSPPDLTNTNINPSLSAGAIMSMGGYCTSIVRLIAGINQQQGFADPVTLTSMTSSNSQDKDGNTTAVLKFSDNCLATLSVSFEYGPYYSLRITGDKGSLLVPNPWVPEKNTTLVVQSFSGKSHSILPFPLFHNEQQVIHISTDTSLYCHEVNWVADYILAGKTQAESPGMSWQDTLGNMQTLDQWRAAIGLSYADDNSSTNDCNRS